MWCRLAGVNRPSERQTETRLNVSRLLKSWAKDKLLPQLHRRVLSGEYSQESTLRRVFSGEYSQENNWRASKNNNSTPNIEEKTHIKGLCDPWHTMQAAERRMKPLHLFVKHRLSIPILEQTIRDHSTDSRARSILLKADSFYIIQRML